MGGKILDYEAKDILNRGKQEGIQEGRKEGIQVLISSLKTFSVPEDKIVKQLVEQYQMGEDEADALVRK